MRFLAQYSGDPLEFLIFLFPGAWVFLSLATALTVLAITWDYFTRKK